MVVGSPAGPSVQVPSQSRYVKVGSPVMRRFKFPSASKITMRTISPFGGFGRLFWASASNSLLARLNVSVLLSDDCYRFGWWEPVYQMLSHLLPRLDKS